MPISIYTSLAPVSPFHPLNPAPGTSLVRDSATSETPVSPVPPGTDDSLPFVPTIPVVVFSFIHHTHIRYHHGTPTYTGPAPEHYSGAVGKRTTPLKKELSQPFWQSSGSRKEDEKTDIRALRLFSGHTSIRTASSRSLSKLNIFWIHYGQDHTAQSSSTFQFINVSKLIEILCNMCNLENPSHFLSVILPSFSGGDRHNYGEFIESCETIIYFTKPLLREQVLSQILIPKLASNLSHKLNANSINSWETLKHALIYNFQSDLKSKLRENFGKYCPQCQTTEHNHLNCKIWVSLNVDTISDAKPPCAFSTDEPQYCLRLIEMVSPRISKLTENEYDFLICVFNFVKNALSEQAAVCFFLVISEKLPPVIKNKIPEDSFENLETFMETLNKQKQKKTSSISNSKFAYPNRNVGFLSSYKYDSNLDQLSNSISNCTSIFVPESNFTSNPDSFSFETPDHRLNPDSNFKTTFQSITSSNSNFHSSFKASRYSNPDSNSHTNFDSINSNSLSNFGSNSDTDIEPSLKSKNILNSNNLRSLNSHSNSQSSFKSNSPSNPHDISSNSDSHSNSNSSLKSKSASNPNDFKPNAHSHSHSYSSFKSTSPSNPHHIEPNSDLLHSNSYSSFKSNSPTNPHDIRPYSESHSNSDCNVKSSFTSDPPESDPTSKEGQKLPSNNFNVNLKENRNQNNSNQIKTLSFKQTLHQTSLSEDSCKRTFSTTRHSIDNHSIDKHSIDNLSNTLNLSENTTSSPDPSIDSSTTSMCPNFNLRPTDSTFELTKSLLNLDLKSSMNNSRSLHLDSSSNYVHENQNFLKPMYSEISSSASKSSISYSSSSDTFNSSNVHPVTSDSKTYVLENRNLITTFFPDLKTKPSKSKNTNLHSSRIHHDIQQHPSYRSPPTFDNQQNSSSLYFPYCNFIPKSDINIRFNHHPNNLQKSENQRFKDKSNKNSSPNLYFQPYNLIKNFQSNSVPNHQSKQFQNKIQSNSKNYVSSEAKNNRSENRGRTSKNKSPNSHPSQKSTKKSLPKPQHTGKIKDEVLTKTPIVSSPNNLKSNKTTSEHSLDKSKCNSCSNIKIKLDPAIFIFSALFLSESVFITTLLHLLLILHFLQDSVKISDNSVFKKLLNMLSNLPFKLLTKLHSFPKFHSANFNVNNHHPATNEHKNENPNYIRKSNQRSSTCVSHSH
ncbi:unnamed protein product [Bemisia tabaci]|uniref:Uncharacterized protein n=1 Tax=Bemisia tabaci TaxID=7038 RepID=A0A9P0A2U1_BEMTA|nr:unnamed protein product [Bemisia tabaci]